jgi:hypothetical protein
MPRTHHVTKSEIRQSAIRNTKLRADAPLALLLLQIQIGQLAVR